MQKTLFLLIAFSLFSLSSIFAQHLKKDGTPDKRYKENKIRDTATFSTNKSKTRYTQNSTTVPQFEPNSKYNYTVKRDANGKIHRSNAARLAFMKQTGYPKGRPGYIIDHIIPLKRGGCDCPANMQWQTIADAKAKDKVESP